MKCVITSFVFFMFHFSEYYENNTNIEIYGSIYEEIDFSEINIIGKYRKIIINKITNKITFEINEELEIMNLEFPVKFEDKFVKTH